MTPVLLDNSCAFCLSLSVSLSPSLTLSLTLSLVFCDLSLVFCDLSLAAGRFANRSCSRSCHG